MRVFDLVVFRPDYFLPQNSAFTVVGSEVWRFEIIIRIVVFFGVTYFIEDSGAAFLDTEYWGHREISGELFCFLYGFLQRSVRILVAGFDPPVFGAFTAFWKEAS